MTSSRARRGLLFSVCAVALTAVVALAQPASLDALRPLIEREHPGVPWISTAELARSLRGRLASRPLLLDARTVEEFEVSHLRGAIRVDPDRPDLASVLRRSPRRVVVYCSVGYRSAAIAERLLRGGLNDVRNLEGGVFRWANEGRPVVRGDRVVRDVHPYDDRWGLMLHAELRTRRPR